MLQPAELPEQTKIIQQLQAHFPVLHTEFGVVRLALFGSYAHGQPTAQSDVDLLVEFERPIGFSFMQLNDYLEQVLGREVDLITPAGLQNIPYPHIIHQIEQSLIDVTAS
jgi:uncharacterized protein